jgi:hypothetical protein
VKAWRDHDGTVCAYGHTVGGVHWMHLPEVGSFCFGEGVEGVMAIAQPPVREDLILDAYRRTVLPMALQALGQEVLHASAVLTPHGVVALCAVSGTGKSTTAFALSQRGLPLWADDAVVFETSGPEGVRAIPIPFGIRLRPDATSFFEQNPTAAYINSSLDDADQVEAQPTLLSALLVLTRTEGESDGALVRIRQLSSAQAFLEVLAHAYCFSLHDVEQKRNMMRHYLDLVDRVSIFEVRFKPGFKTLPIILANIAQLISTFGNVGYTRSA